MEIRRKKKLNARSKQNIVCSPEIKEVWSRMMNMQGCGRRQAVVQLVEAPRYKPEGRGFDSVLTSSFQPQYGLGVESASDKNEYQ
jgi:hypothetical protein